MGEIIKKYWSELKNGTKTMFKEFFNKKTNKKQRANMWTFLRLVTSFLIPICSLISILTANFSLFICSILITGFGGLTDFFDGKSARKHNSYSEFGKFLDQVSDKIFSIMIGINLSLFNPLFLINLLGEIVIVCVNAYYKTKHPDLDIESTQIGRVKQWPLFSSLVLGFISTCIPIISPITNTFILLTFLFQLLTTSSYIKTNNANIEKLKFSSNLSLVDEECNDKDKNSINKKLVKYKNNNKENISKIAQYSKLRDLLIEVISIRNSDSTLIENNYQKTKK